MSRSHSDMLIDIRHLRSCLDCIERPVFFTEQDYQQHSFKHHNHNHVRILESQTTEPMIEEIDFHRPYNTFSARYAEERNYFLRQTEEDSKHHNQSSFLTREKDTNAFQWGESKLAQFVDDITSMKEELSRNGSKLNEVFKQVSHMSTCVLSETSVRNRPRYDDAVKEESMHRDDKRTNKNSHEMEKVFEEFRHLLNPTNSEAQKPADQIDHNHSSLNPIDSKEIENNSQKIESFSKTIENQTKIEKQENIQSSLKSDFVKIELLNKSLIEEYRYLIEKIDVLEVMTSEKEFLLQNLKEGNEKLMQHLNLEKEKCHSIHVKFHVLREEYDLLKKSCTNIQKENLESLQRGTNTLQEELINLTASYDLKVTELSQKQLDLDHTRHVLEIFKSDMEKSELNHSQQSRILEEQFNENVRRLQSTVDENVIEMKNMKDQLGHRTNECDSLNQKVVGLTREIDELISNYEALKASSEIVSYELNNKLKEISHLNDDLEKTKMKSLSDEENIREMKLQLENLLSAKVATDDECEKLRSQLKEQEQFASSKLEANSSEMRENDISLQTEYSKLKETFDEQEKKIKEHEASNSRLQQEIKVLKDTLQKKNSEIETNAKCFEDSENNTQAYKAKIKELENELHTFKEKELIVLNEKDVLSAEIDGLKSELICLKDKKDDELRLLKEKLENEQKNSRDSNKEAKVQLKNKSKEMKQVEKSLATSKIKIDTLKKELADVVKSFEEGKKKVSHLESSNDQKTKDYSIQTKTCESLKAENADLSKKVEELRIKLDSLKKEATSAGLSKVIDKESFPALPTSTTDKEVDIKNNDAMTIPKRNWGEEFLLKRLSEKDVPNKPTNTEEYVEVISNDHIQKEQTIKEWLSPLPNQLEPLELLSKGKQISPSTLPKCVKLDGAEVKSNLDFHRNKSNLSFDCVKSEDAKDLGFLKGQPSKNLNDLSTLGKVSSSSSLVEISSQMETSNLSLKSLPPLDKGSSFSVIDSNHLLGNESWGTLGSKDDFQNGGNDTEKVQDKTLERDVDHDDYSDDFDDEENITSEHSSDFGHEDIATLLDGL